MASAPYEGFLWGAEPRFELGPALQQADALLSESRRAHPCLSHDAPLPEPRRTLVWATPHPKSVPRRSLVCATPHPKTATKYVKKTLL